MSIEFLLLLGYFSVRVYVDNSCVFSFYQVDQNYEHIMVSLESLGMILWICGLGSYVHCIVYANV